MKRRKFILGSLAVGGANLIPLRLTKEAVSTTYAAPKGKTITLTTITIEDAFIKYIKPAINEMGNKIEIEVRRKYNKTLTAVSYV